MNGEGGGAGRLITVPLRRSAGRPPTGRRAAPLALLLVSALGCGSGGPVDGTVDSRALSPETFVTVYIELRRAIEDAPTPEAFAERRRAILERHGVAEDDLLRFAEQAGGDVDAMAAIWDTIRARMNQSDSTGGSP